MGGKSKQSNSQSQKTSPWAPQQGHLKSAFQNSSNIYGQSAGMAKSGAEGLFGLGQQGSTGLQSAENHNSSMVNGDFLNSNPYLGQAINNAARPMVDNFRSSVMPTLNAGFAQGGRLGSGAHLASQGRAYEGLARGLGEMASNMSFNNYGMERGYQNQAAQNAGQMFQNRALPFLMQGQAANMQFEPLKNHMSIIGGNYGSESSGTSSGKGNSMDFGGIAKGVGGFLAGGPVGGFLGSLF